MLLATALLAPAIGYLVGRWPLLSLVIVAVVAVSIGTMWSREFGIEAILASSFVMLGLASWFGLPTQAALLPKVLVGLFALTALLDLGPSNPLRIPITLLTLVAVLGVSAVFGAGNRLLALQALATYIAGPVAYVAIVHSSVTLKSLKRVGGVVVAILAAQVPLVILQARFFASTVDQIGGTFGSGGGTPIQAVVMGFAWTIAVALLSGRRRTWLLPLGLAIAVVLLVSEAKAGFLFAAMGTVAVGLTKAIATPKRRAALLLWHGAIGLGALVALFAGYLYVGGLLPGGQTMATYWIAWLSNPSAIMNYLFSFGPGGQANRLAGLALVLGQSRTMADLLIGQGVGILSSSALLGQTALSSSPLGTTFGWATSAVKLSFETGLLGVAAMLAAIGAAAAAVARSWLSRGDERGVAVAAAAVGLAIVFVLGLVFEAPAFPDATVVVFWCLMGVAVRSGRLWLAET
jgi:hypothetical protein